MKMDACGLYDASADTHTQQPPSAPFVFESDPQHTFLAFYSSLISSTLLDPIFSGFMDIIFRNLYLRLDASSSSSYHHTPRCPSYEPTHIHTIQTMETVLAADIGGTNSRFDLYEINPSEHTELVSGRRAPGKLIHERQYMNADYRTFHDALRQFFEESGIMKPPITACLAVAGPVHNNTVEFTNRKDWKIVGEEVARVFGIRQVRLINDFVAVGYGLLTLNEATECVTLQGAPKREGAPIACIGAGTGLGECYLTPGSLGYYVCYPSEGGHTEFAPRSELEIRLLGYLLKKFKSRHRVSVERVVSGTGLYNIYEFLSEEIPDKVDRKVHEEILKAGDMKGKVIATNQSSELCRLTMDIFAGAYGSEAGCAGLRWLPQGGLYITGGLTPKNIDLIRKPNGPFMRAFKDKGRVSLMLNSVPVYAVLVEDMGRRGAHRTAYLDFLSIEDLATFHSTVPGGGNLSPETSIQRNTSCGMRFNGLICLSATVSLAMFIFAKYR